MPEQIVVGRDKEAARAGVALPAGAAEQLSIDARRLMPLDADYVQPAGLQRGLVEADIGAPAGEIRGQVVKQ